MTLLNFDVRFTPESGHSPTRSGCLLWAISGLNRPGLCCRAAAVAAVAVSNLRRSRLRRCAKLFGSLLVNRAGHGIDNCDGDRHLYVEAGGQKHTQWLAPVSRAASPQILPTVVEPPHHAPLPVALVRRRTGSLLRRVWRERSSAELFQSEPGRHSAAKVLSKDGARRIAANIAKLQELRRR